MTVKPETVWRSCICMRVRKLSGYLTRVYARYFRDAAVGVAQFSTLIVLDVQGPIHTNRIARELGLERSTLSRNLEVMERRGWVKFTGRSRPRPVVLTASGRTVLRRALSAWKTAYQQLADVLGEDRIGSLGDTLDLVTKAVAVHWP